MDIHDGLRILDRWFLPSRIMKKFAYKYILALICSHDIIADEIKCIIKCISSLSPNAIKSGARIMSDMPASLSIRHFYMISFLILLNISRNRVKMFLLSSGFYHLPCLIRVSGRLNYNWEMFYAKIFIIVYTFKCSKAYK